MNHRRLKKKVEALLFEALQKRCKHDSDFVSADINNGSHKDEAIQWCQRCGAYRFVFDLDKEDAAPRYGDWTEPRATWSL